VFIVTEDTIIIKVKPRIPERPGDANHWTTILLRDAQLTLVGAGKLSPAPMSDPITACVPEMGIDEKEDVMMNENDEKQTENITMFWSFGSTLSRLEIIPLAN